MRRSPNLQLKTRLPCSSKNFWRTPRSLEALTESPGETDQCSRRSSSPDVKDAGVKPLL